MSKRLSSVALVALLMCTAVLAVPALAVEDEEGAPEQQELPSMEEVGTQSETSRGFFPEEFESPTALAPVLWSLLIGGIVVVLIALTLYLLWQPRFAEERKQKRARR
jgi:hypothetical protein